MKIGSRAIVLAAMASVSTAAIAEAPVVQPVQVGEETVRYQQGVPTVDLTLARGSVQIRPLPMDHGSLAFAVAVFNGGQQSTLIDIGNFTVQTEQKTLAVFSVNKLIKKAKSRAAWSQFGLALLGATAAAAASSQRDTYTSSLSTPYGTYRGYYSAPSVAGQMQATAITAGTAYGLVAIQNNLDRTREALGDEVVQTSTVDPGRSYAGKIVVEKITNSKLPQKLTITVNWNGEQYPFAFQLAKSGTPAPQFTQTRSPALSPLNQPAQPLGQATMQPVAFAARPPLQNGVDMVGIVKRTAEVMPRPTVLDDGTTVTQFAASGTELVLTAPAVSSMNNDPAAWRQTATATICAARPFAAILYQGGSVRAVFVGQRKQEVDSLQVTAATCNGA